MKGRVVIAVYQPKPGRESELEFLVKSHWNRLKSENLVSNRSPIVMKSTSGTYIEVFEWISKEAIENAHTNPVVQEMWNEFELVCSYLEPAKVTEMSKLFSEFTPV